MTPRKKRKPLIVTWKQAVKVFGSTALKENSSPSQVSNWKKRGVPFAVIGRLAWEAWVIRTRERTRVKVDVNRERAVDFAIKATIALQDIRRIVDRHEAVLNQIIYGV